MVCRRLPAAKALAASTALLLCMTAANAQSQDRPVPPKPSRAEMSAMGPSSKVVVKFREGSGVRLEAGRLAAAPSPEWSGCDRSPGDRPLGRQHAPAARPARAAARRRAGGGTAADRPRAGRPNLYYLVDLPPGADAVEVAAKLNELAVVEFATPQPAPPPPPSIWPPPRPTSQARRATARHRRTASAPSSLAPFPAATVPASQSSTWNMAGY